MIEITQLVVGSMAANCYVLTDTQSQNCIIVDPGDDSEYIVQTIETKKIIPISIVATHGHFDHIMGVFAVQHTYNIPFLIHASDEFLVSRMAETAKHFLRLPVIDPPPKVGGFIEDGQSIAIGDSHISVIHTPGHTPGSVCLYAKEQDMLFCGDTIFKDGGVGRVDFSYSRPLDLADSVSRILAFAPDTILYPGHGDKSLVSAERLHHA